MNTRAEALAVRIELGARTLANFADSLTDAEWNTVVRPDGRTVGVIIHHVATVYTLEVQLAQQVASGTPIEDVTWSVVGDMNALHAREHRDCGKHETIHLLNRNSRRSAEAVRLFTDVQLDTAATVSLYCGARLTAQFLLEDHAVRHSWHHLEKIQASVENVRRTSRRPSLVGVL
jgi:hypothetical protein